MVFEAVKLEGIFGALNFSSNSTVNNKKFEYRVSANKTDTFKNSRKKVNPAQQNPIYAINDTHLSRLMPSLFIKKYSNEFLINEILKQNANIANSRKVCTRNALNEIEPHFIPTCKAAVNIMKKSGENFTRNDYDNMRKAALLHDVGKTLIPDEILNKCGKLTPEEREIVDQHANLSYEILRNSGIKGPVLLMVKNHHTYSNTNPPLVQILQIADIWSALKEKRAYKDSFTNEKALSILYKRAQNGDFEKKYVDALAASI